jgi:hypothetical protein
MNSRFWRSAWSRPAQLSPALLTPVLIAYAPPASTAAVTAMITLRVRPDIRLRW